MGRLRNKLCLTGAVPGDIARRIIRSRCHDHVARQTTARQEKANPTQRRALPVEVGASAPFPGELMEQELSSEMGKPPKGLSSSSEKDRTLCGWRSEVWFLATSTK
ncbi:hypothetical protein Tco_0642291, partial [Tanacetum coccineum]